jgi:hypothetical protein
LGEPFENGATLGGGFQQPVRHHHEHRVDEVLVASLITEPCEVGAQIETV